MDFIIMKKIADFVDARPKLKWINLGPSMEQFSHTMTAQVTTARLFDSADCCLRTKVDPWVVLLVGRSLGAILDSPSRLLSRSCASFPRRGGAVQVMR